MKSKPRCRQTCTKRNTKGNSPGRRKMTQTGSTIMQKGKEYTRKGKGIGKSK